MKSILALIISSVFVACTLAGPLDELMLMTLAQSSNGAALQRQVDSAPKLSDYRNKRSPAVKNTKNQKGRMLVNVPDVRPLYTTTTIIEEIIPGASPYGSPYGYPHPPVTTVYGGGFGNPYGNPYMRYGKKRSV